MSLRSFTWPTFSDSFLEGIKTSEAIGEVLPEAARNKYVLALDHFAILIRGLVMLDRNGRGLPALKLLHFGNEADSEANEALEIDTEEPWRMEDLEPVSYMQSMGPITEQDMAPLAVRVTPEQADEADPKRLVVDEVV